MYQIKTVASLTGINTDTVRAWERRYQAIKPARDAKGRRLYSQADIERLKLLAKILTQGYSIGNIANLDDNALHTLLNQSKTADYNDHEGLTEQMMQSLKKYQIDRCEELLRRALISLPPLEFAEQIMAPALIRVGELWHQKTITISQEHLFSSCIKRLIFSLINNMLPLANSKATIIFTTLPDEEHEFGILLTSFLAANLRYRSYYLSAELPAAEIIKINRQLRADIIVLSLVNTPPSAQTLDQLEHVLAAKRTSEIWLGGAGARYLSQQKQLPSDCIVTDSLTEYYNRLELFKSRL